jgi:hypothetical protein
MSWSDDIRCLYCDGKLALYRKLTNGQFCSAAHRKAYWQEQEKLALERLHQTHDTLLTQRKPESTSTRLSTPVPNPLFVESQFPTPVEQAVRANPEQEAFARSVSNTDRVSAAGFLIDSALLPIDWVAVLSLREPEPLSWAELAPAIPHQLSDRLVRNFAMGDLVQMPRNIRGIALPPTSPSALDVSIQDLRIPGMVRHGAAIGNLPEGAPVQIAQLVGGALRVIPSPISGSVSPLISVPHANTATLLSGVHPETPEFSNASISTSEELPVSDVVVIEEAFSEAEPVVQATTLSEPVTQTVPVPEPVAAELFSEMAAAVAMPVVDPTPVAFKSAIAAHELAITFAAPVLPISGMGPNELSLGFGRLTSLPAQAPAGVQSSIQHSLEAIDPAAHRHNVAIGAFGMPRAASATAQLAPRFAPGARYGIEIANRPVQSQAGAQPISNSISPMMNRLPDEIRVIVEPGEASIVALPFRPNASKPSGFEAAAPKLELITPPAQTPMLMRAKLSPVDGEVAPMPKRKLFGMEIWTPVAAGDPKHVWSQAADFWQNAPRDLKLLVIAIPVLLGLALHPSLPKVRVTAPATSTRNIEEIKGGVGNSLSRQFQVVRRTVAERAAVALNEEFRSGLDDWQARGDLSSGWSFDRNGFVKPGALAFYQPSMHLTDYNAEFLGLIDQKALSFVARAKDFDNYYVIKITIVKPGPVPTIGVTRYAVIDGKPQDRKDTIAPITARPDMLYRVGLSVQGDAFLLTLQGQVTDSWSEPRLSRGGIGFFAARGEESRLRWVQVTHQYDMLGRLCAFLAPQNIPNTNGSW